MHQYMRSGLEDTYGFLQLQNKILEIMVELDRVCKDNDIDYCLMGGSALGAIRHKGFIPWDDDLDVFMTPDNYEKFREIFYKKKFTDKYYLQEWGKCNDMVTISKVRMNNTAYIEKAFKDWDIHHGIYIDIFILHTCPNNVILQMWQCFWAKYIVLKGLSIRNQNRYAGIKKILLSVCKILPESFLLEFSLKQVYRYRDKETKYLCNFLGKAGLRKGRYKKEWFNKMKYTDFENIKLKVPENLEAFLSERFGDYMRIPEESEIKWNQHAESWNLTEEYKVNKNAQYKDERKLL